MKILLLIFILVSCSNLNKKNNEILGVDIVNEENTSVVINKKITDNYGPELDTRIKQKLNSLRTPVISLSLYSSMYHTFTFLHFIKSLEKKKIKLSIISTNGLGVLIASLYAKKGTASYLEWKLFALRKKISGLIVYSEKWKKAIKNFSKKEFGDLKLNQLKVLVIVPELNNGAIKLNKSGLVTSAVIESLNLRSENNFVNSPIEYAHMLMKFGAELKYTISFLPMQIKFKNIAGFNWGVYTKYLGRVLNNDDVALIYSNKNSSEIDKLIPFTELGSQYQEGINTVVDKIDAEIIHWQEEST